MTISAEPKPRIPSQMPAPPDIPGETRPMTYEEYMATPEEMARYDIIDGIKEYRLYGENQLPSPTRIHQRIQGRLFLPFAAYETASNAGEVIPPPCDVLIERTPCLRNHDVTKAGPLSPAPELIMEILSPPDKPGVLAAKLADYRAVSVKEAWVLRTGPQTVEVILLSEDAIETAAVYESGQTAQSVAFPGLDVAVREIFAA